MKEMDLSECMEYLDKFDIKFNKNKKTKFEILYNLLMKDNGIVLHFYKKILKIFITNNYIDYVPLYQLYRDEKYNCGDIIYFFNKLVDYELVQIKKTKSNRNPNRKKVMFILTDYDFHERLMKRIVNDLKGDENRK